MAERVLLAQPEVTSVVRRTGRAEFDEHAQGVEAAELDASLTLKERTKKLFLDARNSSRAAAQRSVSLAIVMFNPGTVEKLERSAAILSSGFNQARGSFTQRLGRTELDAAALMIPLVDFLPADDPLVSAGGLLGPAVLGLVVVLEARQRQATARRVLLVLALLLLVSLALWVRNLFGVFGVTGLAALLGATRCGRPSACAS